MTAEDQIKVRMSNGPWLCLVSRFPPRGGGDPVLDRFRLDGKVAVVTGASSGLGVAFAQVLAVDGGVTIT